MMELSGGMKRRVMIAKALSHEPDILFLDEPTAGVDVELRRDMWELVRQLRDDGTTIILTTHYIEEAEEMADRVGVISKGELILVEDKKALMQQARPQDADLMLAEPLTAIPAELAEWNLALEDDGHALCYEFDANAERTGIPSLLRRMRDLGIGFKDLDTHQSSLEDIFVEPGPRARGRDGMNRHGVWAIYRFEMARCGADACGRAWSTPVITTSLYFVVFGAAIGSRMTDMDGIAYGSFIVPGLIMLSLFTAEHLQRQLRHLLSEVHRHDLRIPLGADLAASRRCSAMSARPRPSRSSLALVILATANLFVDVQIAHPLLDAAVPGADRGRFLPVRLHHRHLGARISSSCSSSRC